MCLMRHKFAYDEFEKIFCLGLCFFCFNLKKYPDSCFSSAFAFLLLSPLFSRTRSLRKIHGHTAPCVESPADPFYDQLQLRSMRICTCLPMRNPLIRFDGSPLASILGRGDAFCEYVDCSVASQTLPPPCSNSSGALAFEVHVQNEALDRVATNDRPITRTSNEEPCKPFFDLLVVFV